MKKTFQLTDPKIKLGRKVDAVKAEINKYIKRERKKKLSDKFDFWDFNCRFGETTEQAADIHISTISKNIDEAVAKGQTEFYLEILAEPKKRNSKAKAQGDE